MYILTYDLCLGLFDIAMTIESARASSNWSCRCSCVLAAARCALFAAALASRSARVSELDFDQPKPTARVS